MISVSEASDLIDNYIFEAEKISIKTIDSIGYILQEDIYSDRDQPPFNRSMMDGIAINYESYNSGNKSFKIEAISKAGEAQKTLKSIDNCLEVMTGAVVPNKTDCVIKIEDLIIENNKAIIKNNLDFNQYQNIHHQGIDKKKGDLLIKKGCKISPNHISVLVSVGKTDILVSKTPSIAIISTGDELVDINQKPAPYQIRMSNSYSIKSALQKLNCKQIEIFHLLDNKLNLTKDISLILNKFDLIILSGGVSKGKYDFIPEVLNDLGVKKVFHRVSQKPGKPFWFGNYKNKLIFALPGNPVSVITCLYRYVIPCIQSILGNSNNIKRKVFLGSNFKGLEKLTLFQTVKLNNDFSVEPIKINNSGDFSALTSTDGFVQLDSGKINFTKGLQQVFYSWDIL